MHPTQRECTPAPLGYWYNIPAILSHDWKLTHPIIAAEAFAVLAAIWQHRHLLTGRDVIFFIDNEAAASAMIKGDSRLPVVGTMAMCVQLLFNPLQNSNLVRVVDSDSNLADGLSRDGVEDPWTLDQHWELHEFEGLPFAVSLASLRDQFFPEFAEH